MVYSRGISAPNPPVVKTQIKEKVEDHDRGMTNGGYRKHDDTGGDRTRELIRTLLYMSIGEWDACEGTS